MRTSKLFICLLLIFCITFILIAPCFGEESLYVWSPNSLSNTNINTDTDTDANANINSKTIETNANIENNNPLSLESASAILIEQSTGQILYSHNIHEQLRPASVTKVMSILLIMEALDDRKNIIN